MATSQFKIVEHVIPGQHIREYPRATRHKQEDVLQIAIKQYIPLHPSPENLQEDAITVIGVHGNGFPKEIYEPLWDDLYCQLQSRGVHVRGIWVADASNQGASGVLNEDKLSDGTNFFDHSRDLLQMINTFRDDMPRPLIGIGHSMGCPQLTQLSMMHPRLLSTLILVEPVILDDLPTGPSPALMSTLRRDIWPTQATAETALRKGFRAWDPRCLEKYLQYGLRPVPTLLYRPSSTPPDTASEPSAAIPSTAVTLTTSKHQEVWSFLQLNLESPSSVARDRLLHPDWDSTSLSFCTARPECVLAKRNLPFVRPSVFWQFGGKSYLSPAAEQDFKMSVTGTGVGGSGGTAVGKVAKKVIASGGHMCVFEQVGEVAEAGAEWLQGWLRQWREDERMLASEKGRASEAGDGLRYSKDWLEAMKLPNNTPRPGLEKRQEKL